MVALGRQVEVFHLTQCIDSIVSLKSIHPQNRRLVLHDSLLQNQIDWFVNKLNLDNSLN